MDFLKFPLNPEFFQAVPFSVHDNLEIWLSPLDKSRPIRLPRIEGYSCRNSV